MYLCIKTLRETLVFLILNSQLALELLKGYTHEKPVEFLGFHLTTQQQIILTHKIILGLST
jgi:hypothetical protein